MARDGNDMRNAAEPPSHLSANATLVLEDDRPEFNPQAADLAWTRTLEFLCK
jgi:hypothetical protein